MKLWPIRPDPSPAPAPEPKPSAAATEQRPNLPKPPLRMYSLLLPPAFTDRR
jgi:hypothetical protein